jgi:endoglucanase
MSGLLAAAAVLCSQPWPQLNGYVESFVSQDGRVLERNAGDRTTSEGQAYALFFALASGERNLFARLLGWTERNLARGDLGATLPAWNWGKRRDGSWGVVDENSASDADLWIAYDLLEAGRLWGEERYTGLARRVLANVAAREVVTIRGLGPMLLPGPKGFATRGGFRLNPSYEPPQLLRRFAAEDPGGPWGAILESTIRMLRETAPRGAVADWVFFGPARGFAFDPVKGRVGSYDAIRTYLWLGMLPESDGALRSLAPALLRAFEQDGVVPERIDVQSLHASGRGPVGFAAALLPLARAQRDARTSDALAAAVASAPLDTYYDHNLVLFGNGFVEGRFRFGADGRLIPAWESPCAR